MPKKRALFKALSKRQTFAGVATKAAPRQTLGCLIAPKLVAERYLPNPLAVDFEPVSLSRGRAAVGHTRFVPAAYARATVDAWDIVAVRRFPLTGSR